MAEQQNKVLDIIIRLLDGIRSGNTLTETCADGDQIALNSCNYLLNQVIRQYAVARDHIFVSEKAMECWAKIRSDDITRYTYRDRIVKNTDAYVTVDKYKGGEKRPYKCDCELKYGDQFTYNDVFTDEHVVTVSNIIAELSSLPVCDYDAVKKVLDDRLYICKMLKSEDREIENRKTRSLDYREVIVNDYEDAGITVVGFNRQETLQTLVEEYRKKLAELRGDPCSSD